MNTKVKPQLHQSMLNSFYTCPERFRRRYGARFGWNDREEIIPPGVALIVGSATHQTVEKNLTSHITTGGLLPLEAIQDLARDTIEAAWQREVLLDEEEQADPHKTKGESIDQTIALSVLHAKDLAPHLAPISVEKSWVVELQNFPLDLAGTWDIEEADALRDTKTAGKSPSQNDADTSEQLTLYAMAKKVCQGSLPSQLYLDNLVKTKEPKIVTLSTTRSDSQINAMLRRIERVTHAIEKGVFTPVDPKSWACSAKWCGYWSTCPFANR